MAWEYFIHKEDFGMVNFTLHNPTNITASKRTDFRGRFENHLHSISLHRKNLKFVRVVFIEVTMLNKKRFSAFNPYPTAFPYVNGMVLHFFQQQESSTTKTVHKVINKGLKTYV